MISYPMTIRESNITITVKDLSASISFYESIGLKLKKRWGDHYAMMMAPGLVIGLHPSQDFNSSGNSGNISIGFTADNFEAVKSLLEKLNIKTSMRMEEGGEFIHFNDPDGSSLYFIKPKW